MITTNGKETSGNINHGLKVLTIDDIIKRYIVNDGIDNATLKWHYEIMREDYGRKVFGGKVVIVRPDLNSKIKEIEKGIYEIDGTDRIGASVETIRELSNYGAKVIVVAHQGTAGEVGCIGLEPHKKVLEELVKKDIIFESWRWYGPSAQQTIKEMNDGDIFLLDNIRKLSDDGGDGKTVRGPLEFAALPGSYMGVLGNLADFFVNDAFSVAHRWQGSVVGFPHVLNIAGRLMEEEIEGNKTLGPNIQHPYVMMLGGVKIDDYLDLVESFLKGKVVDRILATGAFGVVGVLGMYGRDNPNYLGKKTAQFLLHEGIDEEQINRVTGFARRYRSKLILPLDFKVELDGDVFYIGREEINGRPDKDRMGIYGLGPETVDLYKEALEGLKTGYIKGSPTKDDDKRFMQESRELIDTLVKLKRQGATTILSGGNTNTLVSELGYSPHDDFTFVTLAGGAATRYHAGGTPLPGLLMLNTSRNAFDGVDLYKGLENSPVTFELTAPRIPQNLKP